MRKKSKSEINYVRRLKYRFNKLEFMEGKSMNDYNEMQDIRKELIRLGYGRWNL